MTYEEAKEIFETLEVQVPLGCGRDFQTARELAIEALKKQIPTKPNWIYNDEPLCPYCQEVIEDGDVICESCHQLIDWRE